jgi:hypothetical protein
MRGYKLDGVIASGWAHRKAVLKALTQSRSQDLSSGPELSQYFCGQRQGILARREQSGATELTVGAWDGGVIEVT